MPIEKRYIMNRIGFILTVVLAGSLWGAPPAGAQDRSDPVPMPGPVGAFPETRQEAALVLTPPSGRRLPDPLPQRLDLGPPASKQPADAQEKGFVLDDGDGAPDTFLGWGDDTPFTWGNRFTPSTRFRLERLTFYMRTEDGAVPLLYVAVLDTALEMVADGTLDPEPAPDGQWYEAVVDPPVTVSAGERFHILIRAEAPIGYPAGVDTHAGTPGASFFYRPSQDAYDNLTVVRGFEQGAFLIRAYGRVDPGEVEPNDRVADATPLYWGDPLAGAIDPVGDVDFYRFDAAAGDFIELCLTSDALDGALELLDAGGTVLHRVDRAGPGGTERLYYGVDQTGAYAVRVAWYASDTVEKHRGAAAHPTWRAAVLDAGKTGSETGAYTLHLVAANPPVPMELHAASGYDRAVPLRWQATGAQRYWVYRSTLAAGPFTLIGEAPAAEFVDAEVTNETTYHYQVTAIYPANGVESLPSDPAAAVPSAGAYNLAVPFSSAPAIDGFIGASEWGGAQAVDVTGDHTGPVTLYLKHDGAVLYLAVENRNRRAGDFVLCDGYVDWDNDDAWSSARPASEGVYQIDNEASPARVRFEGVRGVYPDGLTYDEPVDDPAGVEAAIDFPRGVGECEIAIDVPEAVPSGATIGLRVQAGTGAEPMAWPPAAPALAPATYANLALSEPVPPAAPRLIHPADRASGVALTPVLRWEQANAAFTYRVEVAADAAFTTLLFQAGSLTATSYTLTAPLQPLSTYYWRVVAVNDIGEAASPTGQFTTQAVPPAAPSLRAPADQAIGVDGAPTLRWQHVGGSVSYRVEIAATPTFDPVHYVEADVTESGFTVPGGVLERGVTYYWRVVAVNSGGETPSSTWRFMTYPAVLQLRQRQSGGDPTEAANYRMIGLPGQVAAPLGSVMLGTAETDWRAFRDRGTAEDYLQALNAADQPFVPGQGIWVVSRDGWRFEGPVVPVELDTARTYAIPLQEGWNILSSPFLRGVPWAAVQTFNDVVDDLYGFDGSYHSSAQLRAYEGYYYYNRDGRTALRIPYDPEQVVPSQRLAAVSTDLVLSARLGTTAEARVRIGLDPASRDGLDRHDRFAPPGAFETVRLVLEQTGVGASYPWLAREVRPAREDGHSFDLILTAAEDGLVMLHAVGLDAFDEYDVHLVDRASANVYDLRQTPEVRLPVAAGAHPLHVLIGDAAYVEARAAELLPSTVRLEQNYPNPFNPSTTIAYAVPASGGTVAVRLEVVNVLGQRIQTLVEARQEPGRYTVAWDGRSATGAAVASGLYLYRLQAGSTTLTRTMLLLR